MEKNNKANQRTLFNSIHDAIKGIWECIKTERNMRIHVVAAGYVIFFAFSLKLTNVEFSVLFLAIVAVISLEMLNTSIEKLCNFNQRDYSPKIRIIKDISAGAVLMAAAFSVFIGIKIFLRPQLWEVILDIAEKPVKLIGFICAAIVACVFIVLGPGIFEKIEKPK